MTLIRIVFLGLAHAIFTEPDLASGSASLA